MKKSTWSRREFLEVECRSRWSILCTKSSRRARVAPSDRVRFGMIGVGMQAAVCWRRRFGCRRRMCRRRRPLRWPSHARARDRAAGSPSHTPLPRVACHKDIDCIVAAVPDHWHKQSSSMRSARERHLLRETDVAQCRRRRSHGRRRQKEWPHRTNRPQRVSSQICAKAKDMIAQGMLGE